MMAENKRFITTFTKASSPNLPFTSLSRLEQRKYSRFSDPNTSIKQEKEFDKVAQQMAQQQETERIKSSLSKYMTLINKNHQRCFSLNEMYTTFNK